MQFAFTVTGLIVRFNTSSLYLGYCCYAVIFSWGVVTHFILPSNCSCCWTLLQLRSSLAKLPQYCFFFPVHLFLCVGCIAVLSSISMPSRRPKKAGSPASASSSMSARSSLSVRRVRGRGPASCHDRHVRTGLIGGHPAAFLSAGLWFFKDHFCSVWLILCSVAPFLSPCPMFAVVGLLTSVNVYGCSYFPSCSIKRSLYGCSFMGHHRHLVPLLLSAIQFSAI